MANVFITGTDTNVGKTFCTVALLHQLNMKGYKTFGLKPVASGCFLNEEGQLVNEDALAIQKAASIKRGYQIINPISFQEPIAPHIAAKKVGGYLSSRLIIDVITRSIQQEADINIIEGVGGWSVPINDNELMSDVVIKLNFPIILVVGIRLGCVNHAILTAQKIMQNKVTFLGWIANCIDNSMLELDENIQSIAEWIPAPCLGIIPYCIESDSIPKIETDLILSQLL
ncbi:MAG: dethiobiotin synthase [Gammaproteobacteria bacterium]|nr:dethiobiotin synthase [Gammaproteobacteria bacterium]